MKNVLLDMLQEMRAEDKVVIVYDNEDDTEEFLIGKVISIHEEDIVFGKISINGEDNGVIYKNIEDIILLETNSAYTKKIEKLINFTIEDIDESEDALQTILQYAIKNNKIVSIELENSDCNDAVGYVKEITEEYLEIDSVNEYGEYDGKSICKIESITGITCNGEYEKRIQKLNCNQ